MRMVARVNREVRTCEALSMGGSTLLYTFTQLGCGEEEGERSSEVSLALVLIVSENVFSLSLLPTWRTLSCFWFLCIVILSIIITCGGGGIVD
jgi:hypothetical protein